MRQEEREESDKGVPVTEDLKWLEWRDKCRKRKIKNAPSEAQLSQPQPPPQYELEQGSGFEQCSSHTRRHEPGSRHRTELGSRTSESEPGSRHSRSELGSRTSGSELSNNTEPEEFKNKIDEMLMSLAPIMLAPRPWSAARTIDRFNRRLEAAVIRMARLGTIDEENEHFVAREEEIEPSVAQLSEQVFETGDNLTGNVLIASMSNSGGMRGTEIPRVAQLSMDTNIEVEVEIPKYEEAKPELMRPSVTDGIRDENEAQIYAANIGNIGGIKSNDETELSVAERNRDNNGAKISRQNVASAKHLRLSVAEWIGDNNEEQLHGQNMESEARTRNLRLSLADEEPNGSARLGESGLIVATEAQLRVERPSQQIREKISNNQTSIISIPGNEPDRTMRVEQPSYYQSDLNIMSEAPLSHQSDIKSTSEKLAECKGEITRLSLALKENSWIESINLQSTSSHPTPPHTYTNQGESLEMLETFAMEEEIVTEILEKAMEENKKKRKIREEDETHTPPPYIEQKSTPKKMRTTTPKEILKYFTKKSKTAPEVQQIPADNPEISPGPTPPPPPPSQSITIKSSNQSIFLSKFNQAKSKFEEKEEKKKNPTPRRKSTKKKTKSTPQVNQYPPKKSNILENFLSPKISSTRMNLNSTPTPKNHEQNRNQEIMTTPENTRKSKEVSLNIHEGGALQQSTKRQQNLLPRNMAPLQQTQSEPPHHPPPPVLVQVEESLCDPSNMGRLNCLSGEQLRYVDKQLSTGTSLRNVGLLRSTGLNKLLKVNLCSNRPPTPTYTQPQPNVPHPPPTTTSAKQPPNNHLPYSQLPGIVVTQPGVSKEIHQGEVAQGDTVDSRGREHIHPPPPTTCRTTEQTRQQQPAVKLPRNVTTHPSETGGGEILLGNVAPQVRKISKILVKNPSQKISKNDPLAKSPFKIHSGRQPQEDTSVEDNTTEKISVKNSFEVEVKFRSILERTVMFENIEDKKYSAAGTGRQLKKQEKQEDNIDSIMAVKAPKSYKSSKLKAPQSFKRQQRLLSLPVDPPKEQLE